MTSLKLVKIEWEDSCQPISEWQHIDAYKIPNIVKCISVGFLIAETKQAIALAPNLGNVNDPPLSASGIIRIPRSAIRKMKKLT